jgi:hypothetical protein
VHKAMHFFQLGAAKHLHALLVDSNGTCCNPATNSRATRLAREPSASSGSTSIARARADNGRCGRQSPQRSWHVSEAARGSGRTCRSSGLRLHGWH